MYKFLIVILTMLLVTISCTKEIAPPQNYDCNSVDRTYLTGIKTIIDTKCAISGCHVGTFTSGSFETYSILYNKYTSGALEFRLFTFPTMPPANQTQLTQKELTQFRCWIDQGAPNN